MQQPVYRVVPFGKSKVLVLQNLYISVFDLENRAVDQEVNSGLANLRACAQVNDSHLAVSGIGSIIFVFRLACPSSEPGRE